MKHHAARRTPLIQLINAASTPAAIAADPDSHISEFAFDLEECLENSEKELFRRSVLNGEESPILHELVESLRTATRASRGSPSDPERTRILESESRKIFELARRQRAASAS